MTEQSPNLGALAAALVAAQADLKNPAKDATNPHFKSRFADLAGVRAAVVPAFAAHGLAVTQLVTSMDGKPALATMLIHASGEWLRCTSPLRPAKDDPQGVGSAITYARRYALQAVAGVTGDDDDDGHHASQPPARPQQQQQPKPPPPAAKQAPADLAASPDVIAELIEELAKARKQPPGDVCSKFLTHMFGGDCPGVDDIPAGSWPKAVASLRKAIAKESAATTR
jgi:hypothetical protein